MHVLGNVADNFDIISLKKAMRVWFEEQDKLSPFVYLTKTVM
jgi:hypothetical protein